MNRHRTDHGANTGRRTLTLVVALAVGVSGLALGRSMPAEAGGSLPHAEPVATDAAPADVADSEFAAALDAVDPRDPNSIEGTGRILGAPAADTAEPSANARNAADGNGAASSSAAGNTVAAAPATIDCAITEGNAGGEVSSCPGVTNMTDALNGLGLAQARDRVAVASARLIVTAQPAGAEVLVDAVPVGNAPVDLKLTPGAHSVRVVMDGYQPFSANVVLSAGGPTTVAATLTTDPDKDGWFYWVDPQAMVRLAGGFQWGDIYLRGFVKDKAGNVYVRFENSDRVDLTGTGGIVPPNPPRSVDPPYFPARIEGVAVTKDKGVTWSLVKAWRSQISVRRWNSRRFTDSKKKDHYLYGYYQSRADTVYGITEMVPLDTGGIAIHVTKSTASVKQTVLLAWDNFGGDISGGERDNPPVPAFEFLPPGGAIQSRPTARVRARWGLGGDDLVTYNYVGGSQRLVYNSDTRVESQVSIGGPAANTYRGPIYVGSRGKTMYYVGKEDKNGPKKRYLFASTDSGRTLRLESTFTVDVPSTFGLSSDDIRMSSDGKFYVVDRTRGVGLVTGTTVRWLGTVPSSIRSGFVLMSGNLDGAGNYHAAISTFVGPNNPNMRFYYQYFPRNPIAYTRVSLFTEPNCATCNAAKAWLRAAGVRFTENPTDLGASTTTAASTSGAKVGYPVLVREGPTSLVVGDASPAVLTRALAKSYPILVDERAARTNGAPVYDGGGNLFNAYGPWNAVTVDESGDVSLIVEQSDGVVAYRNKSGQWHRSRVMQGGYQVPGPSGSINNSWLALLPGGGRNEVPFNGLKRPSDLLYFYDSNTVHIPGILGGTRVHVWWTIANPQKPATTSSARAMATVTQMLPATAFNVELGPSGTAGAVQGELAQYVTGSGITTVNGQRTFEVKVDLRSKGETATSGAIQGRSIGGYVQVQTTNEAGQPETRTVSLILLVQNYRLRYADPTLSTYATDFSSEVVHFIGADDRWVITNNLALPNEIPCGPSQSILLDPFSKATFTAAQVATFDVSSCLEAMKVAPTPITGCQSWEDKKRVLAAETMGALGQSLPLSASGGVTNWELAFGSPNATIRRIVMVDETPPPGGGIRCGSDVDGRSVAIVSLSGRIIGTDEDYDPTIQIEESGTADVAKAATALQSALAAQRRVLELEAAVLEGQLRINSDDAGVVDYFTRGYAARQAAYRRDLLAVRALLHCNADGEDAYSVKRFLDRQPAVFGAMSGPARCLRLFLAYPNRHWETYSADVLPAPAEAGQLVTTMNAAFAQNSTLQFLLRSVGGEPLVYDAFLAQRAWTQGASTSTNVRFLAIDDWARQMTATTATLSGAEGGIIPAVVMSGPVERKALQTLSSCAAMQGGANPWTDIVEKTKALSYTSGLACVDAAATGQARIDRYRYLRLAVFSSIFQTLVAMAASDLTVLGDLVTMTTDVIARVGAAETKYASMTRLPAWDESLPAVDRLVIGLGQARALSKKVAPVVTVGSIKAVLGGVVECGMGIVKSLVSVAGIALLVLGGAIAIVGSAAATGGVSLIFLGSGLAFTGLAAYDLNQSWEQLTFEQQVAGVCGVVASAVMTAAGARSAAPSLAGAARGVKAKMLNLPSAARAVRAGGRTVLENVRTMSAQGRRVIVEVAARRQLSARLKTLLNGFDEGRKAAMAEAVTQLGYDTLSTSLKTLVDGVITEYKKPNGLRAALVKRAAEIKRLKAADPAGAQSFARVSLGLLMEAIPGRPKSLALAAVDGGAVGADADIVASALGESKASVTDLRYRKGSQSAQELEVGLVASLFDSARMRSALQPGAPARPLLTAQEASWLGSLSRSVISDAQANIFDLLASPRTTAYVQGAVSNARRLANVPTGKVLAVEASYVNSGAFKSTIRLQLTIEGAAQPLQIAIKKGVFTVAELETLIDYGNKGLTQKPYVTKLLDGAGFGEVLAMEEWVPGELLGDVRAAPGTTEAIAALDARIFMRTGGDTPGSSVTFNRDLHGNNVKVFDAAGQKRALAIDFDPQFNKSVTPIEYWARSAARRMFSPKFGATGDHATYLRTSFDSLTAQGVSRPTAIAYFRDAAAAIRANPNTLNVADFSSFAEVAAALNGVPPAIDAFLAGL